MTIAPDSAQLAGKRALITGSSRGIGADTARILAGAGARVVVNYREKARRADALVAQIASDGGTAIAVGADLTDPSSVATMLERIRADWGGLDVLILNASGGMESGMATDYALRLNRDAQVHLLRAALPLLAPASRVVFVTSHQAHFIATTPTMPEYEPVARSKRAGEDALRALVPELTAAGVQFVVVSGDMIEGTITVRLLERANPGVIAGRRESAGRLYSVGEFAAEVALAVTDPVPESHTRFVGDTADFAPVAGSSTAMRVRDTSRLIVADEHDAVLLFLTYGTSHDVPPRWITPGGGVDPGEDFQAAGVRELAEETGLRLDSVGEAFAVVESAVDQRWHPYDRGTWAWFAVRTPRFTPSSEGWMPDEHVDIVEHRWWTPTELEAQAPSFEPDDLPDLMRRALDLLHGQAAH